MRRYLSFIAFALVAVALPSAGQGGRPGTWTQATDAALSNLEQLGLARTGDGTLHIAWAKSTPGGSGETWHATVSPAGNVGERRASSTGWAAAGDPDLVALPDGRLLMVFPGLGRSNEEVGAHAAVSDASASAWTVLRPRVSNRPSVLVVGVALRSDGTPIFAYGGAGGVYYHAGLNYADADVAFQGTPSAECCLYNPELATDESNGQTIVAYYSLRPHEPGVFVQALDGAPQLVPDAATAGTADSRLPLVARAGGGVYLAYCKGTPSCTETRLLKALSGASVRIGAGQQVEDVHASRAPEGRIWVLWWDSAKDRIYATRTNKAATRPGPVTILSLPNRAGHVWKLFGEGSLGPLDLFASVDTAGKVAYWHQQVLPVLTLRCVGRARAVTCTVTDAGDPVAGANVAVRGRRATTPANGRVSIGLPAGRYTITATKNGYKSARARATVKK